MVDDERALRETLSYNLRRADEVDRVTGLEVGADDYVGKQLSTPELLAHAKGDAVNLPLKTA